MNFSPFDFRLFAEAVWISLQLGHECVFAMFCAFWVVVKLALWISRRGL